jgi:hypothetical protein
MNSSKISPMVLLLCPLGVRFLRVRGLDYCMVIAMVIISVAAID